MRGGAPPRARTPFRLIERAGARGAQRALALPAYAPVCPLLGKETRALPAAQRADEAHAGAPGRLRRRPPLGGDGATHLAIELTRGRRDLARVRVGVRVRVGARVRLRVTVRVRVRVGVRVRVRVTVRVRVRVR